MQKARLRNTLAAERVPRLDVAPPLADGRYRLLGILGEGGMAIVYRGYDERLEVHRAIKVLSPALAQRPEIRNRFETEARTMAKLQHPNIVSVQDVGADGDRVYMVMELVGAGSLLDKLDRDGPMPPHEACDAIIAILSGLTAAHARGVVHRDIKPHNVLVTPYNQYKVADFGIAHVSRPDHSATRTGMTMGTLAYMAPEQRSNAKVVDGRADLYAVSATLYALLTASEPFELHATDHQEEIFRGIPAPLVDVMKRASRFRATDRYADAAEMIVAVREARASIGPVDSALPPRRPSTPPPPLPAAPGDAAWAPPNAPTLSLAAADARENARTLPPGRSKSSPDSGTFAPSSLDGISTMEPARPTASPVLFNPSADPFADAIAQSGSGRWPVVAAVAVVAVIGLGSAALWFSSRDPERPPEVQTTAPAADIAATAPAPAPSVEGTPDAPPEAAPVLLSAASPPGASPASSLASSLASSPASPARAPSSVPTAVVGGPATPDAPVVLQTLFINTVPYSEVTVDGEPVGPTPYKAEVASGSHRVVLTAADGRTKSIDLTVRETEPTRLCWDFSSEAECSR